MATMRAFWTGKMRRSSFKWPLWMPLWDPPDDIPKPKEEDVLAENHRLANEATIAEVEALESG